MSAAPISDRRSRSFNSLFNNGIDRKSSTGRRKSLFGIPFGSKVDSPPQTPIGAELVTIEKEDVFHSELLENKLYHNKFKSFCLREHSEENVNLMDEIKYWRSLSNRDEKIELLKKVVDTYIKTDSVQEVNIEHVVKEAILSIVKRIGEDEDVSDNELTLAVVALEDGIIKNLMDSHQRFIKTPFYREVYLEEARLNRSSSSASIMSSIGRKSWRMTSSSKASDFLKELPVEQTLPVYNITTTEAPNMASGSSPTSKTSKRHLSITLVTKASSLPPSTSTTPTSSPRSPTTPRKSMSNFVSGLLSMVRKRKKEPKDCCTDLSYRDDMSQQTYDDKTL